MSAKANLMSASLAHPAGSPPCFARPPTVTMFFFGNRNREADYIFGAEWQEMARRGQIQLFSAFSRDQVGWADIERSADRSLLRRGTTLIAN